MQFILKRARIIIRAYLEATCAGDEWVLSHIDLNAVVDRIQVYLSGMPRLYRRLFFVALFTFEYLPFPFTMKLRPFSMLNLKDKIALLENWLTSWNYFKRIGSKLISAVVVICLYAEPKLLSAIGFDDAMEARRNHPIRPQIAEIEKLMRRGPP